MNFKEISELFEKNSTLRGEKLFSIDISKLSKSEIWYIRPTKNTLVEIHEDFLEVYSPVMKTYRVENHISIPNKEIKSVEFFPPPAFEIAINCNNGISTYISEPINWDWGFDVKSLKYVSSEGNRKYPINK